MKRWAIAALATGTALRLGVVDLAREVGRIITRTTRTVLEWHRDRLSSDPLYPVALAAGGGALIQILVPSLSIANALRTVLHTMLGHSTPRLYGGGFESFDDDWESQ